MFTIGQADKIRVFTNVPQANAVGLANGDVAKVAFRELPGKVYTGTVARTSQSIDPTTRTLLVEVDLKNDGRILPGMYATVIFDLPGGGTAPVLLFDCSLYWLGAGLLADALRRRGQPGAMAAMLLVAAAPIPFGQLGAILKDPLLAACCAVLC